jgi:GMP synthase-like glutamine amidotransferase
MGGAAEYVACVLTTYLGGPVSVHATTESGKAYIRITDSQHTSTIRDGRRKLASLWSS